MERYITALPALIYAGAGLAIAVAVVVSVIRSCRDANQLFDDIFDQEREEES